MAITCVLFLFFTTLENSLESLRFSTRVYNIRANISNLVAAAVAVARATLTSERVFNFFANNNHYTNAYSALSAIQHFMVRRVRCAAFNYTRESGALLLRTLAEIAVNATFTRNMDRAR